MGPPSAAGGAPTGPARRRWVVRAEGVPFVASFAPRARVRVGDSIEVVVDTERMHFFDPTTGMAIR